ncbi:hypothetical protein B0A48_09572 [Cryoendolithus antarcticus]|uniref:Transcriptional repressor Tup1 N-terminal domain-containing protein n=1 Tax=Cryoendolithus antarcticus TaxID=1507870 RepID=A0A1V8SZZ3_9PEZI|nr:hypothetical protein B0A48_09572 [Cryoendolithus antarcticus]
MYTAHRGMQGPPPAAPGSRLAELLDHVRVEFEAQAGRSNEHEHQRIAQGHTRSAQVQEMELVRGKIYQLEHTHNTMKARYEDEIARLKHELEQRGGPVGGGPSGPSQPPPPAIGHGPANLFQGIMAGSAAQGGPGLAPPPQDQQGQPGMPGHMQPQGAPGFNPPPGPPHNPFAYGGQPPGPSLNGYGPQQQPPLASPAPARPTPPPNQLRPGQFEGFKYTSEELEDIGNELSRLDLDKLPAPLKRQGEDWHAVFNPRVMRRLDVGLVHTLPHQSVVCCVRFSHDGRFVATGSNRVAQIYDVNTGHEVCHLTDPATNQDGDLYIRSVCFSPDGRYLATGAEDKLIRVWDIAGKRIVHQFAGHEQDIYSLDFASDGQHIASGSGDRTIRLWNIPNEQCVLELKIEDGVTTVAISPDNRFVAAGSLDKSVRIWDVQSGALVERTEGEQGHKDSVYSVAFSPDGRHLVSGSLDKTIKMWELNNGGFYNRAATATKSGKCVKTFEGHRDFVLSVALTPDGQWVMSGSKDRGVQFWDPATGQAQLMLQGHKNSVISVAPSPVGGLFATGSGDMKARIWRYDPYRGQ